MMRFIRMNDVNTCKAAEHIGTFTCVSRCASPKRRSLRAVHPKLDTIFIIYNYGLMIRCMSHAIGAATRHFQAKVDQ